MKRVHIVGLGPRTGTTLMAQSMVACFHIDRFESHERSIVRHRRVLGIFLTKQPGDLPLLSPRFFIDGSLHVIAMMRDPRDVIVSRHEEDPACYWAPLRFWKRHIVHLKRLKGHPRFTVVQYEKLVQEPDRVQAELMARMPFLVPKAPFSAFEQSVDPSPRARAALGGLRPMDTGSIGAWRQHLPRVAGQIAQHGPLVDDLIDFGYERDGDWMDRLAGVEPDLRPSHWPEQWPRSAWTMARERYADAGKIALMRCLGIPKG